MQTIAIVDYGMGNVRSVQKALEFVAPNDHCILTNDFYRSYEVYNPLESGSEQRKPIYILYHYLNHLNIFGRSYHPSVLSCTNQILDS